MTATEISGALRYKYVRNVRIHLRELTNRGLVSRLTDGRFERGDRDLDELAQKLGVSGSNKRQRAAHAEEQSAFSRLCKAGEHWMRTGEVVDPESGAILASGSRLRKGANLSDFRRALLSARVSTAALSFTESVSQRGRCSTKEQRTEFRDTNHVLPFEESKQQTRAVRQLRTDQ
jgi:hypothetical protein